MSSRLCMLQLQHCGSSISVPQTSPPSFSFPHVASPHIHRRCPEPTCCLAATKRAQPAFPPAIPAGLLGRVPRREGASNPGILDNCGINPHAGREQQGEGNGPAGKAPGRRGGHGRLAQRCRGCGAGAAAESRLTQRHQTAGLGPGTPHLPGALTGWIRTSRSLAAAWDR